MQVKINNPNNLPTIDYRKLQPLQGDLKDLTDANYDKLKRVLKKRGFTAPVFVWRDGETLYLMDGHQRQRVMVKEDVNDKGNYEVPFVVIEAKNIKDAKAQLLEITSQYGTITQEGLDQFIAEAELPEGEVLEVVNFDALSFSKKPVEETDVEEDEAPEPEEKAVSVLGTIYQLGEHRIMCGDSTSKDDVAALMGGKKAAMIFTDPPYNVNYSGRGKKTSNTIKNDHMEAENFQAFLDDVFVAMKSGAKKNAPAYVCYKSSTHREFETGLENAGYKVRSQIIWVKPLASMGWGDYRWKHEPILYAVVDGEPVDYYGDRKQYTHWEFEPDDQELLNWAKSLLSEEDEDDTTVWKISRENVRCYEHPTSKPVKLPAKAILNSSKPGEIVMDLFAGGGSTLMAAEATGRICYTMELDERYVDVVRKRWWALQNDGEIEGWEQNTPAVETA